MTKKFDIIPLNGYLYVVDKEEIKEGDMFILGNIKAKNHTIRKAAKDDLSHLNSIAENMVKFNPTAETVICKRIIATSDPSLGITMIPEIDQKEINYHSLGCNAANEKEKDPKYDFLINKWGYQGFVKGWEHGYKAATKVYSEEDMINALSYMVYEMNTNGMGACSVSRHKARSFWEEYKDKVIKKSTPIAVEVEMGGRINNPKMGYDDADEPDEYYPKVINNTLVVKQWIYDK